MSEQRLLACVVTYMPDAAVPGRLRAIAAQVDHVLVVDNTPSRACFPVIGDNLTVVFNENRGAIAGALNAGLRHARQHGYTHVILFDQDTEIVAGLCERLLAFSRSQPDAAIVGPRYVNSSTGYPGRIVTIEGFFRRSRWPDVNDLPFEALFLINSCSLLHIVRIPDDLGYDESLIVDNVDVDFCLALRRCGRSIWCAPKITVEHGIGARRKGAGKWSPTNYSAHRKYLQSRNRVAVWRRYVGEHPGFVLQDVVVWLLDSARTLVLEQGRWAKTSAIVRGFLAGWSGTGDRVMSADRETGPGAGRR